MSEGQKGGMWRRLFGGKPSEVPASEDQASDTPDADEAAADASADDAASPSDETAASVDEERGLQPDASVEAPAGDADASLSEVAGEAAWPEDDRADAGTPPDAAPKAVDEPAVPPTPEAVAAEDDADTPKPAAEPVPGIEPVPDDEPGAGDVPEPEPLASVGTDAVPDDALTAAPETRQGFFRRLLSGLDRTSSSLTDGVTGLFTKRRLDAETLQDLEDVLIQADLGVETAMAVTDRLSDTRYQKGIEPEALRQVLAEEVANVLDPVEAPFAVDALKKPFVVLVVGVNGTGKTTTIGKIAAKLRREGKSVMLAAGDTFRAAAVEQLKIWGERTKSPVVARPTGSDASGLVYDAMEEAAATSADVLMIDTAGRLQNRAELMAELEKVVRVIRKKTPDAPHAVLLVLDATTGQNALNQVEIFGKAVGVTGLVMTKLDGTARGGILVAIAARHKVPVHFVGVGEGIDDLAPFSAQDFAAAIAGLKDGR